MFMANGSKGEELEVERIPFNPGYSNRDGVMKKSEEGTFILDYTVGGATAVFKPRKGYEANSGDYLQAPKDVPIEKLTPLQQDITDMMKEQQDNVMVHSGNILYNTRMGDITHANDVFIPGKNELYCGSAHLKGPGLDSGGQMGVENVYADADNPRHYDPMKTTQKVLDNKRTK